MRSASCIEKNATKKSQKLLFLKNTSRDDNFHLNRLLLERFQKFSMQFMSLFAHAMLFRAAFEIRLSLFDV